MSYNNLSIPAIPPNMQNQSCIIYMYILYTDHIFKRK